MEAFMTPVLPGGMPEHDDIQNLSPAAPHRGNAPPYPAEPIQLINGSTTKSSTPFKDVLLDLLQVHEAELAALHAELEELRRMPHATSTGHQESQQLKHSSCMSPKQDSSCGHRLRSEHQIPRATLDPNATSFQQMSSVSSGLPGPLLGTGIEAANVGRASGGSMMKFSAIGSVNPEQVEGCDVDRAAGAIRSSLLPRLEHSPTATLEGWEQKWIKLVSHFHQYAQQQTRSLHDTWIMSESQHKLAKTTAVDLWALSCVTKRKIRRGQLHGNTQASTHNSLVRVTSGGGDNFKSAIDVRVSVLREEGCNAFMEKHMILGPHSAFRLSWVGLGTILIFYDVCVVPLQSFDYEEDRGLLNFMKWFQAIFWTIDVVLTFFTAVYTADSEVVYKLSFIARKYATSWLLFDTGILIPVWFEQLSSDGSGFADMRALRTIRILRFLRLVRLAKLSFLLEQSLQAINSPSLSLSMKLVQLVCGMIMFSHLNACLWYAVGKQENGWTDQVADTSLAYKYLTAVHWSLTQFQGTSEVIPGKFTIERAYAVVTVLVSMLLLAAFLSNFTNIVMQLQSLTVERDREVNELCRYMRAHKIPRQLSMRVRNYLSQATDDKHRTCEALKILPERLLMELEFEIYHPTMAKHDFFHEFFHVYPRLSRRLCHHELQPSYMGPEDLIFSAQETSFFVYFVCFGMLDYAVILRRSDEALTLDRELVGSGSTLAEPTLWMQWQHKGTLVAERFSQVLSLAGEGWRKTVKTHPPAHLSCILYARRLIAGMAQQYWRSTDLLKPAQVIPEEDDLLGLSGAAFQTLKSQKSVKTQLSQTGMSLIRTSSST